MLLRSNAVPHIAFLGSIIAMVKSALGRSWPVCIVAFTVLAVLLTGALVNILKPDNPLPKCFVKVVGDWGASSLWCGHLVCSSCHRHDDERKPRPVVTQHTPKLPAVNGSPGSRAASPGQPRHSSVVSGGVLAYSISQEPTNFPFGRDGSGIGSWLSV